jgi:hypothetical protein
MLSRIVRQPVQAVARRNMSFLGAKKQDLAACQKNNLEMGLRWTFLRGGKKDDVVISLAFLMGFGIMFSVGKGFYKMSTGQKA